jgi:hypothetical protein
MSRYRVQMVWETEVPAAFYEYLMHKIILTRKNAFVNVTESSLFGVVKYQIVFADKNSRTNSSQKEVK